GRLPASALSGSAPPRGSAMAAGHAACARSVPTLAASSSRRLSIRSSSGNAACKATRTPHSFGRARRSFLRAGLAVIRPRPGGLGGRLGAVLALFGLAVPDIVLAVIDLAARVDPHLTRAAPGGRLRRGRRGRRPRGSLDRRD